MEDRQKESHPGKAHDDPEIARRIDAILRFARFSGPTGDIAEILGDIERGRRLPT